MSYDLCIGRIQTQLNENLSFRIRLHCFRNQARKKIASGNVLLMYLPSLAEMISNEVYTSCKSRTFLLRKSNK